MEDVVRQTRRGLLSDAGEPGKLLDQALDGQGLDDVRIAYVEAIPERLPKVELAEILARERGFTVRVFANRMDAAVWLRHGER